MLPSTRDHTSRARRSLRQAELRSLSFEPGIEFLDHLRRPLCVDLAWSVLSFAQHRVAPFLDHVIHLGFVGEFLCQLRGNERNSLGISDYNVARHYRHLSDPNGDVDSGQHDMLQSRGIDTPDRKSTRL